MKKRSGIGWLVVLVVLILTAALFRDRVHFDWAIFWSQLKHVSWLRIVVAVLLVYATYWMRSARWSVLVSPEKKIGVFSTVGSQFIGFTAVGLFGRLADLTRPYVIARRLGLSFGSQIAVYTVERIFDLGSAAILFSAALALTPKTMPHHEIFVRTGVYSLAGTLFLAVFAFAVRASGGAIAAFARGTIGRVSQGAAKSISDKILDFRSGLNSLTSFKEFAFVCALSLAMWALIGLTYVDILHSFVDTPELAHIGYSSTMLLMGASIGGSLLQLPVIGWFTQIAVTATAMHTFYSAPLEAATACGALMLLVLTVSILPVGVFFAQLERVSLKQAANESGSIAGQPPDSERVSANPTV